MSVITHATLDTAFCADSTEWCPLEGFSNILLCGTYQLDQSEKQAETEDAAEKSSQTRVGRLYVYQLCQEENTLGLTPLQQKDMPGILDIKWSHTAINGKPHFALVNSIGQLHVYSMDDAHQISEVATTLLTEECLGLSLEWDNMLSEKSHPRLTASDSHGQVHAYQLGEGRLDNLSSWKAHDYESWITAFNQWDPHVVFTGGDDCKLKMWDTRIEPQQPVLTSKRHTMGVCSIQSNPKLDFIIATGSYDEQLLIWDSRQMRQPITELGLGGGVWRIKWEPFSAQQILTATMYNGFHVVDVSDLKASGPSILYHYEAHQSIGYGADWCRNQHKGRSLNQDCGQFADSGMDTFTVATCSFYDHLLKLWSFKIKND